MFGSGRRGLRGVEWMTGLGLCFTNPVGTGGYLHILGAPTVQSCCTLWISAS